MSPSSPGTARAEQRRATEAAILGAARATFARLGYERSTIRRIAEAANVDPGLVMHYYGSKKQLFAKAAQYTPEDVVIGGTAQDAAASLLAMLGNRLATEPAASLALLRSMLTNDEAADTYRGIVAAHLEQIAATIPARDAALRADLISAIIHGVVTQRWLLGPSPLAEAAPEDVVALLRPCFDVLFAAPAGPRAGHEEDAHELREE